MKLFIALAGASLLALCGSMAAAQPAPASADPAVALPPPAASPAPPSAPMAKAGTPGVIEVMEMISSKTGKMSQTFAIRLAEPVILDRVTIIPAGLTGAGEIIDAEPPGMGGKPGKLVLAARYLEYNGKSNPLRAFKLGGSGKDYSNTSMAVAIAIGLPGMLVTGGNIEVAPGTRANAKLGADVAAPAQPITSTPTATASSPTAASSEAAPEGKSK